MKIKIIYLFLSCFAFFISGCNSLIQTDIKVSQLQSKELININGDLFVEVTSCSDYSDSRIESESIKEAKETIPYIFKNAQYIQCFRKDFDSYAHFNIPIIISNTIHNPDFIHITKNFQNNLLGMNISKSITAKINKIKEESFGMNDISLGVKIKLINDTNNNLEFKVISAYLDNEPYIISDALTLHKQSSSTIKLSELSIDYALKNSYSPVLLNANK